MSINGKQPMCITAVSVLFLSKICFSYILYQARPTKKLNFYTKYIKLAGYPVCMDKKIAVSWCRSPYIMGSWLVLVLPQVLTKTIAGTGNEIFNWHDVTWEARSQVIKRKQHLCSSCHHSFFRDDSKNVWRLGYKKFYDLWAKRIGFRNFPVTAYQN